MVGRLSFLIASQAGRDRVHLSVQPTFRFRDDVFECRRIVLRELDPTIEASELLSHAMPVLQLTPTKSAGLTNGDLCSIGLEALPTHRRL